MADCLVTSIVMKSNVTLVDISSTRMLGQYGFLAKVGSKGTKRANLCAVWEARRHAPRRLMPGAPRCPPGPAVGPARAHCIRWGTAGRWAARPPPPHPPTPPPQPPTPTPNHPPSRAHPWSLCIDVQVFDVFEKNKISVDVVATSEVSVSLTLDPAK